MELSIKRTTCVQHRTLVRVVFHRVSADETSRMLNPSPNTGYIHNTSIKLSKHVTLHSFAAARLREHLGTRKRRQARISSDIESKSKSQ